MQLILCAGRLASDYHDYSLHVGGWFVPKAGHLRDGLCRWNAFADALGQCVACRWGATTKRTQPVALVKDAAWLHARKCWHCVEGAGVNL